MELAKGFIEEICSLLGDDADALLDSLNTDSPVSVKLNRRKNNDLSGSSAITIAGQPVSGNVAWCGSGFYLDNRPLFTLDPLLHAGVYYVQDASSMIYESIVEKLIAGAFLPVGKSVVAADLCAAPGGKTTSIINALPDESAVLANEFMPQRAAILKENLAKWGYPSVLITNSPVSAIAASGADFDLVTVDAPCSGEGMMRKDEDARSQWSEGLIRQCAALQREILTDAVAMTRPGGCLIYSTCTFNREEDEKNLEWLAEEFNLKPLDLHLEELGGGIMRGIGTSLPCWRFMPHATKGEGLFVAVLQKDGSDNSSSVHAITGRASASRKKKVKDDNRRSQQLPPLPDISGWLEMDSPILKTTDGDRLFLMTPEVENLYAVLKSAGVKILSAGVTAATAKGKDWLPTTQLAMSSVFGSNAFPTVELSQEEALSYLRHEALRLPPDIPKGYVAVTYGGHPLGFIKNIGNRANNLYPQEWRIRMRN